MSRSFRGKRRNINVGEENGMVNEVGVSIGKREENIFVLGVLG